MTDAAERRHRARIADGWIPDGPVLIISGGARYTLDPCQRCGAPIMERTVRAEMRRNRDVDVEAVRCLCPTPRHPKA